jgi:hypothetical protein
LWGLWGGDFGGFEGCNRRAGPILRYLGKKNEGN